MYEFPVDMEYIPRTSDTGPFVVRFISDRCGTVIDSMTGVWEEGYYHEGWISCYMKDKWKLYKPPIPDNFFDDNLFEVE